jgi:hypothetical protein
MPKIDRREMLLMGTSGLATLAVAEAAGRRILKPPLDLSESVRAREDFRAAWKPPIHTADPTLGWSLVSGPVKSRHRQLARGGALRYDVTYSVGEGMRHTEAGTPKAPYIVAAGCSFTFGLGLDDNATWPWLLHERLPDYHLLNVGTMSYGTDQALLAAERQVARFPGQVRAVIVGFADFHIERNRSAQSWLAQTYPFGKPLFARWGDQVAYKEQVRYRSPGSLAAHSVLVSKSWSLFVDHALYHIEQPDGARLLTVALLKEYARRFQAAGAKLFVVSLPHAFDHLPQAKADTAIVIPQLNRAGIATLIPEFPRMPNGRLDQQRFALVPGEDTHPNRAYNTLLADQIASAWRAAFS